jgi:hypothetical protein
MTSGHESGSGDVTMCWGSTQHGQWVWLIEDLPIKSRCVQPWLKAARMQEIGSGQCRDWRMQVRRGVSRLGRHHAIETLTSAVPCSRVFAKYHM